MEKLDSPEAKQKVPSGSPHYEVHCEAAGVHYRIAVNVKSDQNPPDLQFLLDENYNHPILTEVKKLLPGFTPLQNVPGTAALDYIRGNLFDMNNMRILPATASGSANDLNDIFNLHIEQAMTTTGALLYSFGSKWGPETKADDYFGFVPGNGIHDIHMNQANKEAMRATTAFTRTVACLYITRMKTVGSRCFSNFNHRRFIVMMDRAPLYRNQLRLRRLRFFAAMVNPASDDTGKEYVYLLNVTTEDINLNGWMIADKLKKKDSIQNTVIKAGDVSRINLSGDNAQLSNEGGIITLLDPTGLKVDGVSYTKEQVKEQGVITAF